MAKLSHREALELIRQTKLILQEDETILASSDDCDYFRALYRARSHKPLKIQTQKISTVCPVAPLNTQPTKIRAIKQEPLSSKLEIPAEPPSIAPIQSAPSKEEKFIEIQKILAKLFPALTILQEIPSDAQAHLLAERWKTKNQAAPISILSFHETEPQQQFLTHLAQALVVRFGQARLISADEIEKDNQWEAFLSVSELKLVIICDCTLWQMPNLLKFYREIPSLSQKFLLNVPLMLLTNLTLYLKDPLLKRSLWEALCQKIGM